jgi:integrase
MGHRREVGGTVLIRVSANHFAFLRGYLEGLDLGALSRRYLETAVTPDPDLRVARATLRWIREQLMMAARRRGHFPDARLILIDPEKLRSGTRQAIPTLEEFREQRDPHELFSEADLIELFNEEFGGAGMDDRRTARNERLRRRQLLALLEFEQFLGAPPTLGDHVGGWIDANLAIRLRDAGLNTLGELVHAINMRGYRWWVRVPRLGRIAAAQVTAWLRSEPVETALGVQLELHAYTKASQLPAATLKMARRPQLGIVPLEYLQLTPSLDGTQGKNRGRDCPLPASDDMAAIQAWLARKTVESSTWRAYRKEAERLLLWAVIEAQRPLSSLTAADCQAYRDFLHRIDTQPSDWPFRLPASSWCGTRGSKRWSVQWRPFEGALSASSRQQAFTILAGLFHWLMASGYLAEDPWQQAPVSPKVDVSPGLSATAARGLSARQWDILWKFLESLPEDARRERWRFVLELCRETGMRLSELVQARIGDIKPVSGKDSADVWELCAVKGRRISLSARLLQALDRYLAHRGLENFRSCPPSTSLIARLPAGRNPRPAPRENGPELSGNALYQTLKQFFQEAAGAMEAAVGAPDLTEQLRRASTEWLRRTNEE